MFGVLIRSMKEAVVESALSSFRVCRIIHITSHSKSISGCFYALASACFTMFLHEKNSQKIMQSNIYSNPDRVFFIEGLKSFIASFKTAWLQSRRVQVLNWLAWSPDLSPTKNIWCIMTWKTQQARPRTVEELHFHQTKMGQHFSLQSPRTGIFSSHTFTDCY